MALVNYTLPFGSIGGPTWATLSPLQHSPHATAVNSLLYGPSGHQETNNPDNYYKNNPYAPPVQQHSQQNVYPNQQYRQRNNNYLPPPTQPTITEPKQPARNVYQQPIVQQQRTYGENSYSSQIPPSRQSVPTNNNNNGFYNHNYNTPTRSYLEPSVATTPAPNNRQNLNIGGDNGKPNSFNTQNTQAGGYSPSRLPPTYTKVKSGVGSHTQVHAILDYDPGPEDEPEDEYYDDDDHANDKKNSMPNVTPIQGPIYLKNGTVPVVPLFAYPQVNNGTFLQIPIWWTALSVALGLNIRGDIIRGTPCVKRFHQLFCPTAGNSYPIEKIEIFIDENKALMKRMYGDFQMTDNYGPPPSQTSKRKRNAAVNDEFEFDPLVYSDMYDAPGDSYFNKLRNKRQNQNTRSGSANAARSQASANNNNSQNDTGRVDACESKVEIVTPYWASNSAGKIRAIVNTQHFEQAIHQEVCTKTQTNRCSGDCGCEQKYKWHRLLAYDPDNDCKGIFMDWFLFPSCCVCRCNRL